MVRRQDMFGNLLGEANDCKDAWISTDQFSPPDNLKNLPDEVEKFEALLLLADRS